MENKQRIKYTKEFKKLALRACSQNRDVEEIFSMHDIDLEELTKKDKKYLPKLMNKWRQEIYSDIDKNYMQNIDMSDYSLEHEISGINHTTENIFDKIYKEKDERNRKFFEELEKSGIIRKE